MQVESLAGLLLLAVLGFQSFLGLCLGLRRLTLSREHSRATRERLALEIKTAMARCKQAEEQHLQWQGHRKFRVARKEMECENVCSFYLAPHDRKPLPPFKPGQYLTFQLAIPGQEKPVVRCYSLSDSPGRGDLYRVTIKKIVPLPDQPDGKPGLASSFFHDHVNEGDLLNVKAPSGHFFLDLGQERPVVLVGGGVGATPVLSMMNAIVESGSSREVHCFLGFRDGREHFQKQHVERLASEHPNFHLHVCYSRPGAADRKGVDYEFDERVTVALLKRVLPSSNYDYFLCGPAAMMQSLAEGLEAWGVPSQSVFYEAFGPATVKKKAVAEPLSADTPAASLQITFSKSGKSAAWTPGCGSILELAEAHGVRMDSGCRAGNCGSCMVAVKSGAFEHMIPGVAATEAGSCLACVARPKSDLVVDA